MNEASAWRIDLARELSGVYERHPGVRMSAVGGSAARGQADAFSDIDLLVYWDHVDAAWLEKPPLAGEGVKRFTFLQVVNADPLVYLEQYFIGDLKVDVGHLPLDWWASEIADVIERLDTTPDKQETLEGMLDAVVLSGDALYAEWRARIAAYPAALGEKMVREHLRFMPPWVLTGQGLARGDLFSYQATIHEALTNAVAVLAGLNRRYVRTAKLKRIDGLIDAMPLKPAGAAEHVRALIEARDFDSHYLPLVEGTLGLVEEHMPSVDTAAARSLLGFEIRPIAERPPSRLA